MNTQIIRRELVTIMLSNLMLMAVAVPIIDRVAAEITELDVSCLILFIVSSNVLFLYSKIKEQVVFTEAIPSESFPMHKAPHSHKDSRRKTSELRKAYLNQLPGIYSMSYEKPHIQTQEHECKVIHVDFCNKPNKRSLVGIVSGPLNAS